ncbi:MAG TPA: hypothetical protein VG318_12070 [Actinomycetota bacterium]|nr:hypothetical protein [Actinomycetota bacterium]
MSDTLTTSHVLLWILVTLEGLVILALLRQVGSLLLRVGSVNALDSGVGPEPGMPAPWLPPRDQQGPKDPDHLTLLAFLSTRCGACDDLVPALNAISSSYENVDVVALVRDDEDDVRRWKAGARLKPGPVTAPAAFEEYGVDGTPYAFVVDADALVAGRGGVNHIEHLEALLRSCRPRRVDEVQEDESTRELIEVRGLEDGR